MRSTSRIEIRALTAKMNGLAGRIVTDVVLFPAFDPSANPVPPFPPYASQALWDTGATRSVITTTTVAAMGLVAEGQATILHAGGSNEVNTFLVNVLLPNQVLIAGVVASEMPSAEGFGMLIGMDIIGQGDFSITNLGGMTCMSFRIPSVAQIDYVAEINNDPYPQLRSSSRCLCGSGRKYRDCHGRNAVRR